MDDIVADCLRVKSLSEVFKLLSEPNRLRILCGLGLECRSVGSIIEQTGLSQTNVSFHLRLLREAGLVRPEKRGAFVYYCLPDQKILGLLDDFRDWVETLKKPETPKIQLRS